MAQRFNPYFTHIGMEKGLSHKKINCILQDQRGFLWFGTEDGLNRYDGRYFSVFRSEPNLVSGLSGNIISDLYEDKNGILWIATKDGGITKYDYRQPALKQFRQFKHDINDPKSIMENGINKIIEDNQGYLWLASTNNFAIRFNKKTERFDIPIPSGAKCILSFAKGNKDTLLIGRVGGGLLSIDTKTLKASSDKRYNDLYALLPHNSIPAIFKDKAKNYWLGSWDNKVYRYPASYSPGPGRIPEPVPKSIPADEMVSFAEDNENQIWMAGKNTGISVFNRKNRQVVNLRHQPFVKGTLTNDHVNVVYIDRSGIVWVGTDDGLNKYNPLFASFKRYPLIGKDKKNTIIYDFYKDSDQKLWIATSEGIFTNDHGSQSFDLREIYYKGEKLAVTKFFIDQDKSFYIGTDYSLFNYNPINNSVSTLPSTDEDAVMKKLFSSRVVSILRDTIDRHPVLLVSPYGHYLTFYDFVDKKWVSRTDSVKNILKKYDLRDNLIRKLYADKKGNTWISTNSAGLGRWQAEDNSQVSYYANDIKNKYSISSNNIFDILENDQGNLWVSTYGAGLNYFDRGNNKFSHIKGTSNLTEGLALDKKGDLWMLCNGHIHKYELSTKEYSSYELPYLEGSDGLKGYIYKDKQNNLYAAGLNFFIKFNPAQVSKIVSNPEVYFTDFKIFDKSFSHWLNEKVIVLDYFQNFFSIEFSAPEYTGDNISYSYMLEGADRAWVNAGKVNNVNYSNLAGGKYRFKVKATNWNDSKSSKYKSIVIIITPPFWLTWWFPVVVFLVICTLAYFFYQHRMNALLEQQAIRNGIAQDLHDQIGSTLSSISVYSEVAKIYQGHEEASQLNNILETISHTANEMIGDMADIVWAINPKNDNLNSIILRIENFARPICRVKDISFNFEHSTKNEVNIATSSIKKNLYLILKEVINNAVKHSGCMNLKMELKVLDDMLYVKVEDDGIGFDVAGNLRGEMNGSLGGNGMTNIRLRAEEINANLEIKSRLNAGTFIEMSLRIK